MRFLFLPLAILMLFVWFGAFVLYHVAGAFSPPFPNFGTRAFPAPFCGSTPCLTPSMTALCEALRRLVGFVVSVTCCVSTPDCR
jgi:hypothetical protein